MGMPQIHYAGQRDRRAFSMWVERQRKIDPDDAIAARCEGCGAYHLHDEWCEYCGRGMPSVPRIKRKRAPVTK